MVARMLRTKGVLDYCECARRVKKLHPEAVFNYLGAEGNITLNDIKEYIDNGSINYLGTTKDVRPYYEDCAFLILPSHREGCPVAVMEASATGRGIITTNAPGCKQAIQNGYNGFLVDVGDIDALVQKCVFVLENTSNTQQMCENSRKHAENNFDQNKINERICNVMRSV
jgi:glycosyltransferase involved in cell wall biosynthesis